MKSALVFLFALLSVVLMAGCEHQPTKVVTVVQYRMPALPHELTDDCAPAPKPAPKLGYVALSDSDKERFWMLYSDTAVTRLDACAAKPAKLKQWYQDQKKLIEQMNQEALKGTRQ